MSSQAIPSKVTTQKCAPRTIFDKDNTEHCQDLARSACPKLTLWDSYVQENNPSEAAGPRNPRLFSLIGFMLIDSTLIASTLLAFMLLASMLIALTLIAFVLNQ